MKKVFLHLHSEGKFDWVNSYYQFERIPVEGEYVTTKADGEWHKVELVVHTPFSEKTCADVYAVKVNHHEEIEKKINTKEI